MSKSRFLAALGLQLVQLQQYHKFVLYPLLSVLCGCKRCVAFFVLCSAFHSLFFDFFDSRFMGVGDLHLWSNCSIIGIFYLCMSVIVFFSVGGNSSALFVIVLYIGLVLYWMSGLTGTCCLSSLALIFNRLS